MQEACLSAIKQGLTNANIVSEIFSSFTAKYGRNPRLMLCKTNSIHTFPRHQDVKRAELAYLTQHWKEVKKSDAFKTAMRELVKGTYPHAGELLEEIFQAVEDNAAKA